MKLAVVGSRTFKDYELMCTILGAMEPTEVISGGAGGADSLAEKWAREHKVNYTIFHAAWDKEGKGAGFIRNQRIVDAADEVLAFWDGKSNGTRDTLNKAAKRGINTTVIVF